MEKTIKNMIRLASRGDSAKLKEAISSLLTRKIGVALDVKKSDLRKASLTGANDGQASK